MKVRTAEFNTGTARDPAPAATRRAGRPQVPPRRLARSAGRTGGGAAPAAPAA